MNIGSVIMSKRKALGYTQQTLANKLNVSFQAVSKWENGGSTRCQSVSLDFRRTFYALS
jgi:transcriptional regulator with XRE-family HTH domain